MAAPPLGQQEAVCVSVCDSAPLLWRVADLRAVRRGGLVGALLGSLPRTPRQNVRLGRPLLLLPEEETLLREHGAAATLVPVSQDGGVAALLLRHEEEQKNSYERQQVLALRDRKSSLVRAVSSSQADPESEAADEALRRRLRRLESSFEFPRSSMAVQLSTARAGLPHCSEVPAPLRGTGTIPDDPRYRVFRDLRGRGFFLTSAGKFGGDFLVYPGDPLRFHAHFIAVCVAADRDLCVLDVLAVARLGSNVKKTVLLCSPAPGGAVTYTSLQWSGMV